LLENLKKAVFEANLELLKQNLVIYTWGNVSGFDNESKLVVIKPSGLSYDSMKESDMVVVDLDGNIIEGNLRPSSDTPTHLELYKAYPNIGAIVHTHSEWATSFAQASTNIKPYGTTHADYFYGEIKCTRDLKKEEVESAYEKNTGLVIIETLEKNKIVPLEVPGILVNHHGPFAWGKDPQNAVHNAKVLEELAKMAYRTKKINSKASEVEQFLLDKHYLRKHGKNSYYGQKW
jgi:L-ribulose-5-phosphate 4-epimerase